MITRTNGILLGICGVSIAGNVVQVFVFKSNIKIAKSMMGLLGGIINKHDIVLDEFDWIALRTIADYFPDANTEDTGND